MYRHFKQILPDEIPISDRHKKRRGILNLPVPRTEVFATQHCKTGSENPRRKYNTSVQYAHFIVYTHGRLSLLSSDNVLKVAKFQCIRNKAS